MLLVGNYLPSLAVARILGAAGYRVVAGDGGEYSNVRHSRYCADVWLHPPISDTEGFLDALDALLVRRPEITAVVPLQELYVAALTDARNRLPTEVTLVAPPGHVVAACLDKPWMRTIAKESGVPSRPFAVSPEARLLPASAEAVGFPCVIRPADQTTRLAGDTKALICRDSVAVDRFVEAWPELQGPLLVERHVDGVRHNIYFIARSGGVLALTETTVLRSDRLDGTGVAVEEAVVSPDPRLVGYCDAMLERLDYTGVGSVQFIVPELGDPHFLEINPRHDAAAAGVEACGLDMTVAAIDLASGAGRWRPDANHEYPVGRRFAWTSRDLYGLGMAISRREVGLASTSRWLAGAVVAAVRADVHLVWDRRDPRPAVAVYAHLASLGPWRRGLARGNKERPAHVDADLRDGRVDARPALGSREGRPGRDS